MDDIANQGVGVACTKGLKPEVANQDSFVRAAFYEHFFTGFHKAAIINLTIVSVINRVINLLNC